MSRKKQKPGLYLQQAANKLLNMFFHRGVAIKLAVTASKSFSLTNSSQKLKYFTFILKPQIFQVQAKILTNRTCVTRQSFCFL